MPIVLSVRDIGTDGRGVSQAHESGGTGRPRRSEATSTSTSYTSSSPTPSPLNGLTLPQIAGVIVGVLGFILLLVLLWYCCIWRRRSGGYSSPPASLHSYTKSPRPPSDSSSAPSSPRPPRPRSTRIRPSENQASPAVHIPNPARRAHDEAGITGPSHPNGDSPIAPAAALNPRPGPPNPPPVVAVSTNPAVRIPDPARRALGRTSVPRHSRRNGHSPTAPAAVLRPSPGPLGPPPVAIVSTSAATPRGNRSRADSSSQNVLASVSANEAHAGTCTRATKPRSGDSPTAPAAVLNPRPGPSDPPPVAAVPTSAGARPNTSATRARPGSRFGASNRGQHAALNVVSEHQSGVQAPPTAQFDPVDVRPLLPEHSQPILRGSTVPLPAQGESQPHANPVPVARRTTPPRPHVDFVLDSISDRPELQSSRNQPQDHIHLVRNVVPTTQNVPSHPSYTVPPVSGNHVGAAQSRIHGTRRAATFAGGSDPRLHSRQPAAFGEIQGHPYPAAPQSFVTQEQLHDQLRTQHLQQAQASRVQAPSEEIIHRAVFNSRTQARVGTISLPKRAGMPRRFWIGERRIRRLSRDENEESGNDSDDDNDNDNDNEQGSVSEGQADGTDEADTSSEEAAHEEVRPTTNVVAGPSRARTNRMQPPRSYVGGLLIVER